MSYSDVDLRPAIQLDETTRGDFVVRVYQHLLGAIVAFAGIEAVLLNTPFAEGMYKFVRGSGFSWLLILGKPRRPPSLLPFTACRRCCCC